MHQLLALIPGSIPHTSLDSSPKQWDTLCRWKFVYVNWVNVVPRGACELLELTIANECTLGLSLDFISCLTVEYDGGGWNTNSRLRSWKNGKTGRPGFVTNWIGQMLSLILIYRLWIMALWLVLYIASRITRKIQTIYRQCSEYSYYRSIQKGSFWKNVHIIKRSENINSPIIP